jgi:hypothetical protein
VNGDGQSHALREEKVKTNGMKRTMRLKPALIIAALLMSTAGAMAQQPTNVRGTITSLEGQKLTVKTKSGEQVSVDIPESVPVAVTARFSLQDVTPGMRLGVTTIKRPDGSLVAIDVRPISAAANLGLSPWDLQPGSTMTNATVEGTAQAGAGNELTLNYGNGTVKALVVPETAMSKAVPGTRADLKPSETVFVAAKPAADGTLTALRVQVSKDGLNPTQ